MLVTTLPSRCPQTSCPEPPHLRDWTSIIPDCQPRRRISPARLCQLPHRVKEKEHPTHGHTPRPPNRHCRFFSEAPRTTEPLMRTSSCSFTRLGDSPGCSPGQHGPRPTRSSRSVHEDLLHRLATGDGVGGENDATPTRRHPAWSSFFTRPTIPTTRQSRTISPPQRRPFSSISSSTRSISRSSATPGCGGQVLYEVSDVARLLAAAFHWHPFPLRRHDGFLRPSRRELDVSHFLRHWRGRQ